MCLRRVGRHYSTSFLVFQRFIFITASFRSNLDQLSEGAGLVQDNFTFIVSCCHFRTSNGTYTHRTCSAYTKTEMIPQWNFQHWLHRKLSKWKTSGTVSNNTSVNIIQFRRIIIYISQQLVQPVKKWIVRDDCILLSMMASTNGNIFRVTGPLCGEFTGHRWFPLTKASDAELLMFPVICAWTNGWVNNRDAGDLRGPSPPLWRNYHHCTFISSSFVPDSGPSGQQVQGLAAVPRQEPGCCSKVLVEMIRFLSLIAIILTFPIALCFCVKVSVAWHLEAGEWPPFWRGLFRINFLWW